MEVMKVFVNYLILLSTLYFTIGSVYAKGDFEVVGETMLSHSASYKLTKLKDGRILISDFDRAYTNLSKSVPENEQFFKYFEIYDPKTKKFAKISQPKIWHNYHTKPIVLDDGKVLLVGSLCPMEPLKTLVTPFQINMCNETSYAEIYNPIDDTYETVGKLQIPRAQFGIVKLNTGNVLITNGVPQLIAKYDKYGKKDAISTAKESLSTLKAEIYNAKTKTFSIIGTTSIKIPVLYFNKINSFKHNICEETILLDSGEVLVLWLNNNTAEIFNPQTSIFRRVSDLNKNRDSSFPAATVHKLLDGRVAIIGGSSLEARNAIEIFDPKTEKFYDGGSIPIEGKGHLSVLTSNGKILIYGGILNHNSIMKGYSYIHSMILYDPVTQTSKIIDESPIQYNLGKAILLDDGSIFFLTSFKGRGRGVVYKNEELMRSKL